MSNLICINRNDVTLNNVIASVKIIDNTLFLEIEKYEEPTLTIKYNQNQKCIINLSINKDINIVEETDGIAADVTFNINAAKKINVIHHVLSLNNKKAIKIAREINLLENSTYSGVRLDLQSQNSAVTETINMLERDAIANLRYAILSDKKYIKNYQQTMKHQHPHTTSSVANYGICKESSQINLTVDGNIAKGNYSSSITQQNRILVFDKTAHGSIKPNLFIDENDVKASHAAAVGSIDTNQIYYLCSRGLSEEEAKNLIILGYFLPTLELLADENLKQTINDIILKRVG